MRVDFVKAMSPLVINDPQSMFITGDLGYNALEALAAALGPKRFINAGVAEQNMVGLAAGIALTGYKPWIYSIAPFATYRCLEQIRNDVCLHRLPVRIVGNGGGFTYGIMGSTHHALEDIAVLKALPNMTLYFPCANDHVAAAVNQMHTLTTPAYLRLAISAFTTAMAPLTENPVTLTRQYSRSDHALATVVGAGHGVQIALAALAKHGLSNVDVFGVARFPLDLREDHVLAESAAKTQRVIVLEEHYCAGGVGESLKLALPAVRNFTVLGAQYSPTQKYGSPGFHMKQCELTPEILVKHVS